MRSNRTLFLVLSLFFSMAVEAGEMPRQLVNAPAEQQKTKVSLVVSYRTDGLSTQSSGAVKRAEVLHVKTKDAEGYAAYLKQKPGVFAVEPNYLVSNPRMPKAPIVLAPSSVRSQSVSSTPNDPAFSDQWAWQPPTQEYPGAHDILAAARKSVQKRKLRIGVADSGFHQISDLKYTEGYNFSTVDGPGADFYTSQINPSCTDSHGTAVAGIIAATTNNFEGVAGIVDTELYAARVMSCGYGAMNDVATGIYWLAGQPTGAAPTLTKPVDIINISLGSSTSECPTYLQGAIDFAVSKGVLVVVAAGNDGTDVSGYSPANCNNVITVGSVDRRGKPSDFSNRGSGIDIAALGELVRTLNGEGQASLWFGTSFATPNITGIAGLLKQHAPTLSPEWLALRVKEASRYPQDYDTNVFKGGIADANRMITKLNEDLSDIQPSFKPALADIARCHRNAYLNTSVDPSQLETLYEIDSSNLGPLAADEHYTVFALSKNQPASEATIIAASQESKFLIPNIDLTENEYLFDICKLDDTGCRYGKTLSLNVSVQVVDVRSCSKG
ncbi:S8 family peptidase [Marinobacter salexigens]|uniref:S8 family serine peptidase n=1 Tax=Marinobacter salexigens TaxID=1925763 RepID=A0ABS6A7N7_9GAMM|nr:S8 family serine peptidase [Marinobacter salexigens]MBU2874182.1 S8 family serine peptidase [Marinobacter salexigens]